MFMILILQGQLLTMIKMGKKANTKEPPSLHYVMWAVSVTAPLGPQH